MTTGSDTGAPQVSLEDLYGEETANWMRLTPTPDALPAVATGT